MARALTDAELDHAEAAFEEFETHGATDKGCPRCGSALLFEEWSTAYAIGCSGCDFGFTSRG